MLSSPTACVKICKFLSVLQSYSPETEIRVSGWLGYGENEFALEFCGGRYWRSRIRMPP
jgi:hypothetical protein